MRTTLPRGLGILAVGFGIAGLLPGIARAEARPWARSIRQRVSTRQMPPWHIDQSVGVQKFKNDMSLSQKEIDTIVAWVDAGAPQGDAKDMPAAKTWPDGQGWNYAALFGEPDLIIRSTAWTQKAGANDTWWKPARRRAT